MSAIFALANQKGGVAKTTTTGTLAAGLKKQGFSVLTIDCDPQGNLSMSVAAENQDSATMYEVMKGTVSAREAIQHTPSCDIIPANTILAGIEQELHNVGKEMTLREKLRDEQTGVAEEYDYILIDCPPSLGLLTVNALTAADYLLIPTMAETFAASGITQLYDTYKSVKKLHRIRRSGLDGVLLDATPQIPQLLRAGVGRLLVDGTLMEPAELARIDGPRPPRHRRAVAGRTPDRRLPGSSAGCLFNGIE